MGSHLRIVLVRCAEPLNVGAVARAMKNCDLDDLVLVSPRTEDWVTARRVAVHAEDLLASPNVVPLLAEAVADCRWVVGTSSRSIAGRERIAPREVAERASGIDGRVALVFGGEESGLANDDLARCHALSCIPSGKAQPSFNLAQAVMLYSYEWFVARVSKMSLEVKPVPRAPEGELCLIEDAMRGLLSASQFSDVDRPRHGVVDLMQPLRRAGLTLAEAKLWHAALRAALKGPTRP